jgi:SET domain-containing protein
MHQAGGLLELRPSPIHGSGAFALQAIPAGTRIIEYLGERIAKAESLRRCAGGNHGIFHLDDQWDVDGNGEKNPARFLNHSCAPNCHAEGLDGGVWILAQRDIARGEELSFNYGYDLCELEEHPCRCGANQCVRYIVAEEFHDLVRRRNALGREIPPPSLEPV